MFSILKRSSKYPIKGEKKQILKMCYKISVDITKLGKTKESSRKFKRAESNWQVYSSRGKQYITVDQNSDISRATS